jgi:hypothetical protein
MVLGCRLKRFFNRATKLIDNDFGREKMKGWDSLRSTQPTILFAPTFTNTKLDI